MQCSVLDIAIESLAKLNFDSSLRIIGFFNFPFLAPTRVFRSHIVYNNISREERALAVDHFQRKHTIAKLETDLRVFQEGGPLYGGYGGGLRGKTEGISEHQRNVYAVSEVITSLMHIVNRSLSFSSFFSSTLLPFCITYTFPPHIATTKCSETLL